MATLESIQVKIAKLQAQAADLATTRLTTTLEKISRLMEAHGVTVADIEAYVGKRRGRKPDIKAAARKPVSVARYRDPKTGATWTGHGRAPGWIANAKDRSRFLVAVGTEGARAVAGKPAKAGNYIRGPQPALFQDPKTGATWSGRGRAPSWIANAKDRSKFLIGAAGDVATQPRATTTKSSSTKKVATRKTAARKVAAKKAVPVARKSASSRTALKKAPDGKSRGRKVPAKRAVATSAADTPTQTLEVATNSATA